MAKTVILGAGLAGLSVSHHLGHERCVLLERSHRPFGHIASAMRNGFTWDEGPHVSFTKHEYVRELFAASVPGGLEEFDVRVGNYFQGHWVDHPAQVSLHQVPEPLRSQCVESFLQSRREKKGSDLPATDYQEWLERAFGPIFAATFPAAYTRKYWTREPRDLAVGWVGERVLYPAVEDVIAGAKGPLGRNPHYIRTVRYPRHGGYQSFARKMRESANIVFGAEPATVDLKTRQVRLADGTLHFYDRLISTIPLPVFLKLIPDLPTAVADAAEALTCSELLLVNVTARHVARRPETWFYVYDEDKLSTRVNFTEHLSLGNAPAQSTGVQVEVYASRHRPLQLNRSAIETRVKEELINMGLLDTAAVTGVHSVPVPWANVIFDHSTRPALETIWTWLEQFGLMRESADTHPLTDWSSDSNARANFGHLAFAGRYGQWKYFWTDDCVLRGRQMAGNHG